jgi:trans-4-hydroxy-L-proline dehydratase
MLPDIAIENASGDTQRGCTPRVRALREQSMRSKPRISMGRARIVTNVYRQYECKVSAPKLRALVLLHYMRECSLFLGDHELIVGEKTDMPQSAPTFPEICCHSVQDMEIMRKRELISFDSTEEDCDFQRNEIIPFWAGRTMRDRLFSQMTPEWKTAYEAGIFTEFMEQRGPGHTVGSGKIYEKGFLVYQRDIAAAIYALDVANDPDAASKREQLEAMSIACDAIMTLGARYAALAEERARKTDDALRRVELRQIAENCRIVPAHRPSTFWQALQMYWFVHLCVTIEINPWDAYSPGRLDQHLNPFYETDLNAGVLTRDGALELLECLWVKFNNQPAPPKVGVTLKESGTYTDFANINTGGIRPDGQDGVNEVSYLILDCMNDMRLLQPSSNVQISCLTPKRFLERACEISREGWGQPAFYNTEAIVAELLNAGKTLADARLGGASGCVETGAFGNEAYILTGYFNLPKILEITLNNGCDPVTGREIGLKLGQATNFTSFEALFDAFRRQIEYFVEIKIRGSNVIEQLYAQNLPVPFLSVITIDCILKGMDYNAGGARYNTSYLQGVGIATVTDSLSAIRYHVFEKRRFTMETLMCALAANFDGYPHVLSAVREHTPRYGNDDETADAIMQAVFTAYRDIVTGRTNTRSGAWRVNMLPTTCHVYFGEVLGASADGRLAGKPVSEGISPAGGADRNGPTAVLQSCAKMEQLTTGGTLLNQKFAPEVLAGPNGLRQFANLIRAYFAMDGHHVQFNVIDRQTLLEARDHPAEHPDLIVRVAGYSDHFRNLSRALQNDIIDRTEQSFRC